MSDLLPIITISILILLTLKQHIHILPVNTFAIEEYYSFIKKQKVYRISKPNKIFFSITKEPFIKYIVAPLYTQELYCNGILKDYANCDIKLQYNINISNNQEKLRNIFYWFPYATKFKNVCLLDKNLNSYFSGIVREFLFHYNSSDFHTPSKLDEFKNKLVDKLEKEYDAFLNVSVISVRISFSSPIIYKNEDKRIPAEINIESLTEANYNMQQINQILKANDEGIVLSHISPIVPDRIIRKIRESYNNNKEKLDELIEQLSIKTKTQEEIDNICKEIASL